LVFCNARLNQLTLVAVVSETATSGIGASA
jgi:hypothetical protein